MLLHALLCKIRINYVYLSSTLLFFIAFNANGQNVLVSGGKKVSNVDFSLNYSIGELSVQTYENADCFLTQGQQQGNLIVTSLNDIKNSKFTIKAYPNPTNDFVMIDIESNNINELEFSLRTITGRLLQSKRELLQQQKIEMNQYVSGTYFLSVTDKKKKSVQTFKIIKQ